MLISGSDHAIFAELQRDGRAPFTAVAERLGLSEAQVRRRVRWLTDADVFAVTAVADPAVLGLSCMAWIGIEVRPSHTEHAANALVQTPGVDYVVLSSGRFNLMCEVACPQPHDLDPILVQLRRIDGVERTETFIYLSLLHQQFQWLFSPRQHAAAPSPVSGVTVSPSQLESLDIEVIRELERDGRRSFRDIARMLGVSERLVSSRYSKLVDDNVLKVIAVGNPLNLGFETMAWLGVTLQSDADHTAVAPALASIPTVDYVVVPSGRYDLMAEIVCRDRRELLAAITNDIGAIAGIAHVETFLYLRLLYRSTAGAWGVGRSLARTSQQAT
ncbi:MAG: Lrp/AsnC family transcriptional regulator [Actinomycetota bacterium]|nr:Lrp/AsnC family transcriptional regulator [Actinomycetota bacterium]